MSEVETIELVKIGDQEFDKNNVTPSAYFDYVKEMKQTVNDEDIEKVINGGLKMLERTKITGQTAMAKQITHEIEVSLRVLKAAKAGFDAYVARKDVEKFIENVSNKCIKTMELSEYPREIPEDVIDRIAKAKEYFDGFYVLFTDYTLKETKKVAKERREKDPILFATFFDKSDPNDKTIYVEDKYFFIADWVDDNCDLTLKEIVQDFKNRDGRDIVYKVRTPEDEEQIKAFLKSFDTPIEENKTIEPEKDFFGELKDKIKKAVSKKSSTKKTTTKKSSSVKK